METISALGRKAADLAGCGKHLDAARIYEETLKSPGRGGDTGSPPRPETLIEGLLAVHRKMASERGWLTRVWTDGRKNVAAHASRPD